MRMIPNTVPDNEPVNMVTVPDKAPAPIGGDLPLDVAAALLGTKWAEPLNELRPRH